MHPSVFPLVSRVNRESVSTTTWAKQINRPNQSSYSCDDPEESVLTFNPNFV